MEEDGRDFHGNMMLVLRGSCKNKRNPLDVYEYFRNDDICEDV
jgi:hypothetical protein